MDQSQVTMPSVLDDYLFDLQGFLVLKGAIDQQHLKEINGCIDAITPLKTSQQYPLCRNCARLAPAYSLTAPVATTGVAGAVRTAL